MDPELPQEQTPLAAGFSPSSVSLSVLLRQVRLDLLCSSFPVPSPPPVADDDDDDEGSVCSHQHVIPMEYCSVSPCDS